MHNLVEKQSFQAHWVRVSPRPLFSILIAFAMFFAPFGMQSGRAMAAMPLDHQSQMMAKGHCGEQSLGGKTDKNHPKSCCVATGTAIAAAPNSPDEPFNGVSVIARPALKTSPHSYLARLATPPPRAA